LATTDAIINACLEAIGESDVTNPVSMTRAKVLALCNTIYLDAMKKVRALATYTYDASDANHTITNGVGTLPTDYLMVHRVYDGDAPDNPPLRWIKNIEDKVENTAKTSQFMIPDLQHIWIYGQEPTNGIKLYYFVKPTALTDANTSSPALLDEKFHIGVKGIFECGVKAEYAKRDNSTYDQFDMLALYQDLLNEIEDYHNRGKVDDEDTNPIVKIAW